MGWKDWVYGDLVSAADFQSLVQDQTVQRYADSATRSSTLGSAVAEGMVSYLDDTNAVEVYNGSAWSALGAGSGNVIINGAFDIWQRGTSFSNPSGTYTADRFAANGPSGDTVSQQTFTPGTAPVAGYEGQYHLRYATGATAGSRYFFQRVEDVRTLAGQTATFSFWARVNTGTATLYPYFYQQFGSGGSADNPTAEGSFAVTTTWTRFSYTTTMPSVSGKTIGAGSSVQGAFRFTDVSKNLDIWGVQLEAGSSATPFKRNAPSIQAELAACQRYCQLVVDGSVLETSFAMAAYYSATLALGSITLPVQMRTTPTLTQTTGTNYYQVVRNGGSDPFDGFTNLATSSATTVNFSAESNISGTAGHAGQFRTNNGSARILLTAEL